MEIPTEEGAAGLMAVLLGVWGRYRFVTKNQLNDKLDDMKELLVGRCDSITKHLDTMNEERSEARTAHSEELTRIHRALGRLEGRDDRTG